MADYVKIYEELQLRLGELAEKRDKLEADLGDISTEISGLQETLKYLSPLAGYNFPDDISGLGITQAVRAALGLDCTKRFSAAEVRAILIEKDFDFTGYSAPDSTVRTVLNRLVESGKATMKKEGWKAFYSYQATDEEVPF